MSFSVFFRVVILGVVTVSALSQSTRRPVSSKKAPPAATGPVAPAKMSNNDVIALASAGLGDDIITAKIRAAAGTNFDTSIDGLKALKAAGVSSTVIRTMIDPTAAPVVVATPVVAPAAPAVDTRDDPDAAHSPGIYIFSTGKDGHVHLTKLDHVNAKQTKTSGAFLSGMTYGIAKAHVKVSIEGAKAGVETTDGSPVFYAYIPEDNNSFGGSALTVKDFTLIKLDPKQDSREVNTATISPWGASMGTDQKAKQGFSAETVKPGVYKLALIQPLQAGQYAFQSNNYGAFYDFGIIPTQ